MQMRRKHSPTGQHKFSYRLITSIDLIDERLRLADVTIADTSDACLSRSAGWCRKICAKIEEPRLQLNQNRAHPHFS